MKKNKYPFGSYDYWQEEIKLSGLSKEEYWRKREKEAPKCPHCGTAKGFSFGTGDCACEGEY